MTRDEFLAANSQPVTATCHEAELADTERRLTTAPTEKAAKFLRAKHARLAREIDAINRTIQATQPETGSAA